MEPVHSASTLDHEVGRRIRQARVQMGVTQSDLGAKLGVSGQQIQKYESGRDAVPLHRLLKLASICGVPPQAFLGHEYSPADARDISGEADIGIIQLVRAYRRIGNANVRKRLLQLVKQMAGDGEECVGP
jgi:transcriptional regulator with XRE-family HTH domain